MVNVVLTAPPEVPAEGDRTMQVPLGYAPEHAAPEVPGSGPVVAGVPAATSDGITDGVPRPIVDDDDDRATRPVEAISDRARSRSQPAEVDDGWGPPGTTIPPPFLGANQGIDETNPSVRIPI